MQVHPLGAGCCMLACGFSLALLAAVRCAEHSIVAAVAAGGGAASEGASPLRAPALARACRLQLEACACCLLALRERRVQCSWRRASGGEAMPGRVVGLRSCGAGAASAPRRMPASLLRTPPAAPSALGAAAVPTQACNEMQPEAACMLRSERQSNGGAAGEPEGARMGRLRRLLARRPSSSIRRQRRRANHGGGRPSEARGAVGRRGCGQAAAMALGTGPPPLSRPRRGGGAAAGPPPPRGPPGAGWARARRPASTGPREPRLALRLRRHAVSIRSALSPLWLPFRPGESQCIALCAPRRTRSGATDKRPRQPISGRTS
jgi:hypothetical protein